MTEIVIAVIAILIGLATALYVYYGNTTDTEHPSAADYYSAEYYRWMFPM